MREAEYFPFRGVRFALRQEARWAFFLSLLHLSWEYQGDLAGHPAFLLSDLGERGTWLWVAIEEESADEVEAPAFEVARRTQREVAFVGELQPSPVTVFFPNGTWAGDYRWCQCWYCEAVGLTPKGDVTLVCPAAKAFGQSPRPGHHAPWLLYAFLTARSKRFRASSKLIEKKKRFLKIEEELGRAA